MSKDKEKLKAFVEALREADFYSPLRAQGSMTSGDVYEACEVVTDKIEAIIYEHFGEI